MSCTPDRRASYQLEVARQASMKTVESPAASAQKEAELEYSPEPDQQQPSPLVVRKGMKRAVEEDESDEDNNQEEEVVQNPLPFSLHRRLFSRETQAQEPKVAPFPYPEKKLQETIDLRKNATLNRDPPLTTVRLRQENAALKLKLSQLGNQHEAEIRAIQAQLERALTAREEVEQTLQRKITQLEKHQAEATATAQKCQLQVESLLEKLRAVETRPEKTVDKVERRAIRPPTTYKASAAPEASLAAHRRGNGSPLPYGKHAKYGSVKPFAWRENAGQIHISHAKSALRPATKADESTANKYRMSGSPLPLTARYVPVTLNYDEANGISGPVHELPSPFGQQLQAPLPVKPSSRLFSYCADVLSSKFSQAPAPSPSPNMKVMPAWKVEEMLQKSNGSTSTIAHDDTPLPGDFTAITMPPSSFKGGEALPAPAGGDSLFLRSTSKITEYLSQAVVPILETTSL